MIDHFIITVRPRRFHRVRADSHIGKPFDIDQVVARLAQEQAQANARAEAATRHALKDMALTMGVPRLARTLAAQEESVYDVAALSALAAASIQAARMALADWVA